MVEFNIEKISTRDAKMIIAAIDYYKKGIIAKQNSRIIKSKKESSLIEDLKVLKENIEHNEMDSGVKIKECIRMDEENEYKKLINDGKDNEEVKDRFMYISV